MSKHTNLHPYIGLGVTIIKDGITKGSVGIIEDGPNENGKFKVDFCNGFCGWYLFGEFKVD